MGEQRSIFLYEISSEIHRIFEIWKLFALEILPSMGRHVDLGLYKNRVAPPTTFNGHASNEAAAEHHHKFREIRGHLFLAV